MSRFWFLDNILKKNTRHIGETSDTKFEPGKIQDKLGVHFVLESTGVLTKQTYKQKYAKDIKEPT